jgi:hypothetical protein
MTIMLLPEMPTRTGEHASVTRVVCVAESRLASEPARQLDQVLRVVQEQVRAMALVKRIVDLGENARAMGPESQLLHALGLLAPATDPDFADRDITNTELLARGRSMMGGDTSDMLDI